MRPIQLEKALEFSIKNQFNVLVKGAPGLGKTDISKQAAQKLGYETLVSHPVTADPTDFKGLPSALNGEAVFLPYTDLKKLIEANKPLVWLIDDIGQSTPATQAAIMHILLARHIGEHRISDQVAIIACTNRREDRAGVSGILEPVKSRFYSIIELELSVEDWVKWAMGHQMPAELIAFMRFKGSEMFAIPMSKDMVNTPSPRTVAQLGRMQEAGLLEGLRLKGMASHQVEQTYSFEYEMVAGAVGASFAAEYLGFIRLFQELPTIQEILVAPSTARLPQGPSSLYAVTGLITKHAKPGDMDDLLTYLSRMPVEYQVACLSEIAVRHPDCMNTTAFGQWVRSNQDVLKV